MAISRREAWPQILSHAPTPIRYLTENGFSIIRLVDLDPSARNSPSDCRFLVQRDDEPECEVQVSFAQSLIADLRMTRRTPLSDKSIFWLVCAESCLANYLWEHDNLPSSEHLAIDQLSPDALMLALHWHDRD